MFLVLEGKGACGRASGYHLKEVFSQLSAATCGVITQVPLLPPAPSSTGRLWKSRAQFSPGQFWVGLTSRQSAGRIRDAGAARSRERCVNWLVQPAPVGREPS